MFLLNGGRYDRVGRWWWRPTLFMASSVLRPVGQHGPTERKLLHEQPWTCHSLELVQF